VNRSFARNIFLKKNLYRAAVFGCSPSENVGVRPKKHVLGGVWAVL
jgi:hypothetical protein